MGRPMTDFLFLLAGPRGTAAPLDDVFGLALFLVRLGLCHYHPFLLASAGFLRSSLLGAFLRGLRFLGHCENSFCVWIIQNHVKNT